MDYHEHICRHECTRENNGWDTSLDEPCVKCMEDYDRGKSIQSEN